MQGSVPSPRPLELMSDMPTYRGWPECQYCNREVFEDRRLRLVQVSDGQKMPVHDTCEKDYRTYNLKKLEWHIANPRALKRGQSLEDVLAEAGR